MSPFCSVSRGSSSAHTGSSSSTPNYGRSLNEGISLAELAQPPTVTWPLFLAPRFIPGAAIHVLRMRTRDAAPHLLQTWSRPSITLMSEPGCQSTGTERHRETSGCLGGCLLSQQGLVFTSVLMSAVEQLITRGTS